MDWLAAISENKAISGKLNSFIDRYGFSGLETALSDYAAKEYDYVCATKNSVSKFKISDIYYLKISGHDITYYTACGAFRKYGSLTKEVHALHDFGIVKCSQSCAVSLTKVRSIQNNQIILINDEILSLSRNYYSMVLLEFHNFTHRQ